MKARGSTTSNTTNAVWETAVRTKLQPWPNSSFTQTFVENQPQGRKWNVGISPLHVSDSLGPSCRPFPDITIMPTACYHKPYVTGPVLCSAGTALQWRSECKRQQARSCSTSAYLCLLALLPAPRLQQDGWPLPIHGIKKNLFPFRLWQVVRLSTGILETSLHTDLVVLLGICMACSSICPITSSSEYDGEE